MYLFLEKIKKRHDGNLNVKLICDNRKFWKQAKPLFNNKITTNNNFTFMENSEIIFEPTQCAEIMNNFFSDTALKLDVNRAMHRSCMNDVDPILKAIEMYKDHPSILEINLKHYPKSHFNFEPAAESLVLSIIKDLDSTKSYQKGNIPRIS